MSAPDLTTEVIGYRQWRVTPQLLLRAAHKRAQVWNPGDNEAICDSPSSGMSYAAFYGEPPKRKPCKHAPGANCECGFYALHDPSDFWYRRKGKDSWQHAFQLTETDPLVSGVIVAWGNIEVHHSGFRAQHAKVVALAVPESKRDAVVVRATAAEYGVACVPVKDLPRIASEFGVPVPEDMRPERANNSQLEMLSAYQKMMQQALKQQTKAMDDLAKAIAKPVSPNTSRSWHYHDPKARRSMWRKFGL